jgi:lysyl-tRNA synthetase class 2
VQGLLLILFSNEVNYLVSSLENLLNWEEHFEELRNRFRKKDKDNDFDFIQKTLKRGNIIGAKGVSGTTMTGELSIRPTHIEPLSYCMHMIPKPKEGENPLNKDTRYRQRYLDLIMNNPVKKIFETRNKIVDFIRK